MVSINKVTILGRLGRDPETRTTSSGTTVVRLAVATDRRYKDASGERQKETEWHSVSIFGKTAEIADQYLRKGSEVLVEGRLHTRKYTDKDGIERWSTDIICESMTLGARPEGEQQDQAQKKEPEYSEDYRQRPSRAVSRTASRSSAPSTDDDGDIPF